MNQIKLNGVLGLSILGCGFLSYNQYIKEQKFKQKMMMLNDWPFHDEILRRFITLMNLDSGGKKHRLIIRSCNQMIVK
jgi:hypothetical protein